MEGCFVGNGEHLNFSNMHQFPTSDPVVWNLDEEAVLDELYGMLTAADTNAYDDQLNHIPQMQDTNMNDNLPEMNKLQHFDVYKPQFPLTSNHAASMPVLPTQDQPMNYNQIQNSNRRPDFQVPQQQQPNVYAPLSRYPHAQNNTICNPPPQNNTICNPPPQNNTICNPPPQNNTICNPPPQNIPPSIIIPAADKVPSNAPSAESTLVTFVDLKTFYEKGQCRLQGKSEQRLDYASSFVRIYLENPDNIQAKSACVERSPDAAHILKDNVGQVPLKILPDESDHWIKVNLDDAGSEVYKLSKVKGEERNLFRIGVKLLFKDTNKSKTFYSDAFQIKSKPKATEGFCEDGEKPVIKIEPSNVTELKKRPAKRSRIDEQGQDLMMSSPLSTGSSVFPEVITDHLEAATANIKHLKVNHPIQTPRGDVAYHFKLKDCPKNIQLEEGDLIGFFENPHDGKSEIRRLTCDNARYAKLAGVISRSAWLEGKTPGDDDKDPTDVVCVIGVVKVKVRGPVENGERIYASLSSYPGVAMPEHVITQVTSQELTLIGQSLESGKDSSADAVNLVSCFVSILLSIQTQHTNKALSDMRTDVLGNIDSKIKRAKKKLLRGLQWKLLILVIFLSLLGVLLYQLYAPLTALRYWRCSLGSIDDSTSSFSFTTTNFQVPKVNGIEFHFDDLMDKLDANYKRKENDTMYRYYLNIDRCAAGGLKHGVRGPLFYVIDKKCSVAYYYFDGSYRKYKSGRNFLCSFDERSCGTDCGKDEKATKKLPSSGNNKTLNTTRVEEQCLSGIKRKQRSASFKYTSSKTLKQVSVDGIEVTIEELQLVLNETMNEAPKDKSVRYFYNLKRCSENALGPKSFAVIGKCDNSHYYSDSSKRWKKYRSAKDIQCIPSC